MKRKRWWYLPPIIITTIIGLATRRYPQWFPGVIATYGGDVLYATLIVLLLRLIFLQTSIMGISIAALLFCFCIELSQLWQGEWINSLRRTTFGRLVLGQGFLWSDFLCYTLGVLLGALVLYGVEKGSRELGNGGIRD